MTSLPDATPVERRGGAHRAVAPPGAIRGRAAMFAIAAGAAGAASVATIGSGSESNPTPSTAVHAEGVSLAAGSSNAITTPAEALPTVVQLAARPVPVPDAQQLFEAFQADAERLARDADQFRIQVTKPTEGAFTSGFGMRWGAFHGGIDIANSIGTPILAVMDGEVIDAGAVSGYGQWVRIRHADGAISVYGHIETIDVRVGQRVSAGQKIAGMGSRGFSTGSHLHFEIWPDGSNKVDPVAWLDAHGIHIR